MGKVVGFAPRIMLKFMSIMALALGVIYIGQKNKRIARKKNK